MQAAFAANAWHAAGNDGDEDGDTTGFEEDDGPMWVLPPKAEDAAETMTTAVIDSDEPSAPAAEPAPREITEREVLIDIAAQLTHALERVTTMCDHVIQYVEVDRAERHAMLEAERAERRLTLEALGQLVRAAGGQPPTLPASLAQHAERLLGGSMPAGPEVDAEPELVLDLTAEDRGPQVRCRFDDVWLDGFEVSEVMHEDEGVRYRLRRVADGTSLPELFTSDDIRPVEHPDALAHLENIDDTPKNGSTHGSANGSSSHWSPL
jgi:hypothetical protein